MPLKGTNTENFVIRGRKLTEHKSQFWISVNLSDTFKTWMKQDKQSICVTVSRRENGGTQPTISNVVYLIMVDMNFT